jgi:DNA-binding NarL/FixJ family response regulator
VAFDAFWRQPALRHRRRGLGSTGELPIDPVLHPDVVALDLGLRDGSGLDAIAALREGGARVVILSMQNEPSYARKAFELGAQGYVVKDAADDELAGAIDGCSPITSTSTRPSPRAS